MIEKLQNIINMLKDYIKHFSGKKSYKFSVENAKNLLQHYENKLKVENKINSMYNNLN